MNDLFWVHGTKGTVSFRSRRSQKSKGISSHMHGFSSVLVVQVSLSLGDDLPTGETSQNFGAAIIPEI